MIDKVMINPSSSSSSSSSSTSNRSNPQKSSRRKSISHVDIENFLSELPTVYDDKSSTVLTRSRRLSLTNRRESLSNENISQLKENKFVPPANSDASLIREYCQVIFFIYIFAIYLIIFIFYLIYR